MLISDKEKVLWGLNPQEEVFWIQFGLRLFPEVWTEECGAIKFQEDVYKGQGEVVKGTVKSLLSVRYEFNMETLRAEYDDLAAYKKKHFREFYPLTARLVESLSEDDRKALKDEDIDELCRHEMIDSFVGDTLDTMKSIAMEEADERCREIMRQGKEERARRLNATSKR